MAIVGFKWGDEGIAPVKHRSNTKFETPHISTQNSAEAMKIVLAEAGATAPRRDAVDCRIVDDVKNRTGKIIDSPDQVGGYPKLAGGTPPADMDHDGMPDEWERQMNLNLNNPSDSNGDLDSDGYANIEEYLHSLLAKAESHGQS